MDFTLDFSNGSAETVFPNLVGADVSVFSFQYSIVPGSHPGIVDLTLWGVNDLGRQELWSQKIFTELPDNSSFGVKFWGLKEFDSFALTAYSYGSTLDGHSTLTVTTIPEPPVTDLLLFLAVCVIAGAVSFKYTPKILCWMANNKTVQFILHLISKL
jgi:hypothetical protein